MARDAWMWFRLGLSITALIISIVVYWKVNEYVGIVAKGAW